MEILWVYNSQIPEERQKKIQNWINSLTVNEKTFLSDLLQNTRDEVRLDLD